MMLVLIMAGNSWVTQTPMVLEVNSSSTILSEVIDRIITLGVNSPLIMLGSNVIYETGDDLEKNMVLQFEKNLDKVCITSKELRLNSVSLFVDDHQETVLNYLCMATSI